MMLLCNEWDKAIASLALYFLCAFSSCGQSKKITFLESEVIALSTPRIEIDSLLFRKNATVKLILGQSECDIRYTIDGSEVTENSLLYEKPVRLQETTVLQAKGFHPQFKSSETVTIGVRKIKRDLKNPKITLTPEPHQNYKGQGSNTLLDSRKGTVNFREGDFWLGFQEPTVSINLTFDQPMSLNTVVFSLLNDQDSWIFLPHRITIHSGGKKIGSAILSESGLKHKKQTDFIEIEVLEAQYNQINVSIMALEEIPEWHPGKGTSPWTFIDEILIE